MPHPSLRRLPRAGLAAALVAAALAAVAPAASAATAAPVAPPRLRVLTYNTFLMSKNLYPNWGQDHRAAAIPAASFFQGNDVVVLEEAFDNSASDALKRNASAQYPYQTPVVGRGKDGWDATGGSYSALSPEDGGVTLLSKWPVLHREQFIYQDACGSDALSDKGFLYAVLDVNGTRVHVVGTHTQSDDTACGAGEAAGDRSLQLKQIDAFLAAKNIPADEEVMVAGDLNIDSRSAEYTSMLRDGGWSRRTRAPVTPTPSTPRRTRWPATATPATRARTWTTYCTVPVTPGPPAGGTRWSRRRARPGPCAAGAPTTPTRI